MLDANFHAMTGMGDEVLKPFLQVRARCDNSTA